MVDYKAVILRYCEARKHSFEAVQGMNINVNVKNITPNKDTALIEFEYSAVYLPKTGFIRIGGDIIVSGKPAELKTMGDYWKKTKTLPREMSETVLNMINMAAGVNGVLVTRALDMPPPFMPTKLEIKPKQ